MDYNALARQILTRFYGDKPKLSFPDIVAMARALEAENVIVRKTDGVPVTVYVAVGKYDDGSMLADAECMDDRMGESACVRSVFHNENTHRCKSIIYVPPVVVPGVEGEVIG